MKVLPQTVPPQVLTALTGAATDPVQSFEDLLVGSIEAVTVGQRPTVEFGGVGVLGRPAAILIDSPEEDPWHRGPTGTPLAFEYAAPSQTAALIVTSGLPPSTSPLAPTNTHQKGQMVPAGSTSPTLIHLAASHSLAGAILNPHAFGADAEKAVLNPSRDRNARPAREPMPEPVVAQSDISLSLSGADLSMKVAAIAPGLEGEERARLRRVLEQVAGEFGLHLAEFSLNASPVGAPDIGMIGVFDGRLSG